MPDIYIGTIRDLQIWFATPFPTTPIHAVAFSRGDNIFCVHTTAVSSFARNYPQSITISKLVARVTHATHRFTSTVAFDRALTEHLSAAMRGLSNGYDVVQESYDYVEILQHIGEQLTVVCDNKWDSVDAMRDALRGLTGFIVERFIKLTSTPWQERREETLNSLMTRILQSRFGNRR